MVQKSRAENNVNILARSKGLKLLKNRPTGTYFLRHHRGWDTAAVGLPDLEAVIAFLEAYELEAPVSE